jgi:hypothetical protein
MEGDQSMNNGTLGQGLTPCNPQTMASGHHSLVIRCGAGVIIIPYGHKTRQAGMMP